jgi:hypothetical protein
MAASGRRRYGVLLLTAAALIALLAFANARVFSIKYIEVVSQGTPVYTDAQIIQKSGVSVGDSIFAVNRKKVQARLDKDPGLTVEDISRVYPDRLYISVTQHGALACISHLGQWITLSEACEALDLNAPADSAETLIEIRGLSIRAVCRGDRLIAEDEDCLDGICRILSCIQEYDLTGLVMYIDVADSDNIWIGIRDGCRVWLGPAVNEKEKIRWLASDAIQQYCLQDPEGTLKLSVDSPRFIPSKDENDDDQRN